MTIDASEWLETDDWIAQRLRLLRDGAAQAEADRAETLAVLGQAFGAHGETWTPRQRAIYAWALRVLPAAG